MRTLEDKLFYAPRFTTPPSISPSPISRAHLHGNLRLLRHRFQPESYVGNLLLSSTPSMIDSDQSLASFEWTPQRSLTSVVKLLNALLQP
mgnify:CR=1 FL=1